MLRAVPAPPHEPRRRAPLSAALAALLAASGLLLWACSDDGGTAAPDEPAPTGTTAPSPRLTDEAGRVAALQEALEREHAAVYLHGLAAGRLRGDELDAARAAIDEHRARRDALVGLLRAATATPTAASPTYPVPAPDGSATDVPRTRAEARELVATVERGLDEVYALLATSTDPATAALAAEARPTDATPTGSASSATASTDATPTGSPR